MGGLRHDRVETARRQAERSPGIRDMQTQARIGKRIPPAISRGDSIGLHDFRLEFDDVDLVDL